MQWMHCKNCRDKCATPKHARHPPQHKKEQNRCECVEKNVCKMMSARFQSVKLAIHHVRNPCQRMPIGTVGVGKSPSDARKRQALRDFRICINIFVIVEVDKSKFCCLAKNNPNDSREKNTNPKDNPPLNFNIVL